MRCVNAQRKIAHRGDLLVGSYSEINSLDPQVGSLSPKEISIQLDLQMGSLPLIEAISL